MLADFKCHHLFDSLIVFVFYLYVSIVWRPVSYVNHVNQREQRKKKTRMECSRTAHLIKCTRQTFFRITTSYQVGEQVFAILPIFLIQIYCFLFNYRVDSLRYLLASMYSLQLIKMRTKPNVAKNAPNHKPKFISSNMVSVIVDLLFFVFFFSISK